MSVTNVNNSQPQKPQKPATTGVIEENGKFYSIFDKAPLDGTISTDEQRTEFLSSVKSDENIISLCKKYKVNCEEFFKNFAAYFVDINTDGTINSAKNATETVRTIVSDFVRKLRTTLINKFTGIEKQPPSVTSEKRALSEDCIDYFISKIVNMGLEYDEEIFADVFARYDYDLNGDDSVISPDDIGNGDEVFMNHDYEGNIIDTHVLDYLANVYASKLKNK